MLPSPATGLSYASGGAIALAANTPASLAQAVAARVQARPGGVIRSYRGDGQSQARSRAALWQQAGDIAAALAAAGAAPSSFVVILATDILDFVPACWACLRGGYTPVALMHAAREALHRQDTAFEQVLSRLGQPAIVVDEGFAATAARLPGTLAGPVVPLATVTPAPGWTDHAGVPEIGWIVATSGSAGRPKLVTVSNEAMLYRNCATHPVNAVPLPHSLGTFPLDGLSGQHAAFLHYDEWTQIAPQLLTANPAAILDAIERYEIATLTLTSSMMRAMLAAEAGSSRKRRLGSLRLAGLGAEPVLAGIVQQFAALLARHGADPGVLIAGYGATETGSLVGGSRALLTTSASEPACMGPPWHGVAMRIVGEGGAILPEGEVGALEISCPAKMFSAYLGDAEQTAAAFTADGWWRSGDLGQLIAGELTLRGRAKDVLIQHGRKLQFADIDALIQQVLGVGGVGHGFRVPATGNAGETLGIAFDAGPDAGPDVAAALATAVLRRFGIQPHPVVAIAADRLPRTASGKLQRDPLAALAMQMATQTAMLDAPGPAATAVAWQPGRLETIWSDVLGLDRAARADDDFFALGGDSLRAVALDLQIGAEFGVRVPGEAFFAAPSFGNLVHLVQQRLGAAVGMAAAPAFATPWPLPETLRQGLMSALTHWPGERGPGEAVITGYHTDGERPPIFWVFNHPAEAAALSQALGPSQPLYAMRSGFQLIGYHEDEIQVLALRYVSEIMQLRPAGPLVIAGNCQGGIIALAIGHHLLRRKRHIPLLVLLDWAFDLQPYQGKVLIMSGVESTHLNPRLRFARPELAWSRGFADVAFAALSGGYAEAFHAGHIDTLVQALRTHLPAALAAPPRLLPGSGYSATIAAPQIPRRLRTGESRVLQVVVGNDSDVTWAATPGSGLVLSSRWRDRGGDLIHTLQPCADIAILAPAATASISLKVVAPDQAGAFTLVLDLREEGNRWFGGDLDAGFEASVEVVGRNDVKGLVDRVRERLRGLAVS